MRKLIFVAPIIFLILFLSLTQKKTTTPYQFPTLHFFPKMPVAENNELTNEGVLLGKYLFYDPILSDDSTISCSSCHQQKFAFSDNKKFSNGFQNLATERHSMPLFNLAWNSALFWDGRASTLEHQVFHPVRAHNEMNLKWTEAEKRINNSKLYRQLFYSAFGNQKIDSTHIAFAIAQFERTLISHNSKFDKALRGELFLSEEENAGFVIATEMTIGGCFHCHNTDGNALGTSGLFSNNGLDSIYKAEKYIDLGFGKTTGNQNDNGKFKIPSLRNLAFTAPYMHDGRFKTLEEVIDFYSEGVHPSANIDAKMTFVSQGGAKLSANDKRKLIAYLNTLNDSSFVNNPEFSNPHKN